ncbi:hypothetical protein LCGC14_2147880 [marine sediment metagenome]|uniref:Uncharacterized protein n=1 Tax=marine sediment metagenome TaxID=412755 RepID=A0A0F9DWL9_9ZZZZ
MFEGMMYSVGSYAATIAIGYLLGWWRTNSAAKAIAKAFSDGKLSNDELRAGVRFVKTLFSKVG